MIASVIAGARNPLADDDGTDLLVTDKISGRMFGIQVKARYVSQTQPTPTVQFDTRLATFREDASRFILAAVIDPENGAVWRAWLIPAHELKAISNQKRGCHVITPNPSERSNDRYSTWKCDGIREVATRLIS